MCTPLIALAAGASALSAYATIAGSQAQASALKQQASAAQQQGYQNENDSRDNARSALAEQLAALSTRGTAVDSGSPLALLQQSARNQELDALRLRADGLNKAQGLRTQASMTLAMAPYTAGAQLLGGAAKLAELGAFNPAPSAAPFTPEMVTVTPPVQMPGGAF